jgi:integrase
VRKKEIKPLNPEEAQSFLKVVKGDRLEALYSVALAVRLRRGEALALRWEEDVDLDKGTITVRNSLQRIDGKLVLVEPKSERGRRTIALPDFAVKALRQHRARQTEERLLAGKRWQQTGYVFTTTIGTAMDGISVTRRFQRILKNAGLPRQRFHDLRHAAASLLLAQGVNPRVVMEILGHSQISLTLNTYSHVIPSLQRDATRRMDGLFGEEVAAGGEKA